MRPLGRLSRRFEDANRTDLEEIGVNMRTVVNSTKKRQLENTCGFGIEPLDFIRHGAS